MTREDQLRETLAHNLEAAGYLALAKSARGKGLETFVSTALAFADAEAAAMRERAAECVEPSSRHLAAAIRALPATGEVGRG